MGISHTAAFISARRGNLLCRRVDGIRVATLCLRFASEKVPNLIYIVVFDIQSDDDMALLRPFCLYAS